MRLERPGHGEHLAEVRRRVRLAELGRVRDVLPPPDHDRVTRLPDIAPDEIGVRYASREDTRVSMRLVGAAFGAHRARLARAPCLPVVIPGAAHAGNASVPES